MILQKKHLIITGVVIVLIIIVLVNLTKKPGGKKVETAIVEKGSLVSRVTASGELRAKSQVDISAETIGRIKNILFQEGDYVKKGALLIELDDVKAEANLRLAEAQLKQAEQNLMRGQTLFEKNLISQQNLETIKLEHATARAQYEQQLDAYKKTKIYAPISGKIMKINVEPGETAVMGTMNYQGTVMMTIADMSTMIAVVRIDETFIPDIRLGLTAKITADALPDSTFTGMVTKVGLMPITSELTTEKVTDFEVEIEMNEFSPLLRPGMNVKSDITTNEKTDVLKVPIQAVGKRKVSDRTSETLFIIHGNKASLKEITTGVASDIEIEIISGVSQGDTVIIGPYQVLSKLKDGQFVTFEFSASDTTKQSTSPLRLLRVFRRRTS